MKSRTVVSATIAAALAFAGSLAHALDESAAQALMKKSGCLKCHSLSAKKEGPSFRETAAKYKGKPDAEAALFRHLTTNPVIEVYGNKERHDSLKSKDEVAIRNVVQYILSR